jgi:hypothetical protein
MTFTPPIFMKLVIPQRRSAETSCAKPHHTENVQNWAKIHVHRYVKVLPSPPQPKGITRSFVLYFTKISQEIWKFLVRIHLCTYAQYDHRSAKFQETHACLQCSSKNPSIKFHENLANLLPSDTRSQTTDK